jgi:uncharacterized membrane protein
MTQLGHLWAVGYDHTERAAQVREEIIKLRERHCLILLDAAVAVRYSDGCVTLDRSTTPRRPPTGSARQSAIWYCHAATDGRTSVDLLPSRRQRATSPR